MADPYLDRLADFRCEETCIMQGYDMRCVFKMNHKGLHRSSSQSNAVVWGTTKRLTEEMELHE